MGIFFMVEKGVKATLPCRDVGTGLSKTASLLPVSYPVFFAACACACLALWLRLKYCRRVASVLFANAPIPDVLRIKDFTNQPMGTSFYAGLLFNQHWQV
jgi:hypothetical protein